LTFPNISDLDASFFAALDVNRGLKLGPFGNIISPVSCLTASLFVGLMLIEKKEGLLYVPTFNMYHAHTEQV
jgi:hypothetical protein